MKPRLRAEGEGQTEAASRVVNSLSDCILQVTFQRAPVFLPVMLKLQLKVAKMDEDIQYFCIKSYIDCSDILVMMMMMMMVMVMMMMVMDLVN